MNISTTASALDLLSLVSAFLFMGFIAWYDYCTYRIPNRWVYSFGLVSLLLAVLHSLINVRVPFESGPDVFLWPSLWDSILGFSIGFSFTLFFWSKGWMGGGDVKLASALGLCLGVHYVLHVLLLTHVLAFVANRLDWLHSLWTKQIRNSGFRHGDESRISMGPFYAFAMLIVLS